MRPAMAVMTHAHTLPGTLPGTTDYATLTPALQDQFNQAMATADDAATNTEYAAAMTLACAIAGIARPAHGDIAHCGCTCNCTLIFDSNAPGVTVITTTDGTHNLSTLQCPACTDDHRADPEA